MATSPSKRKQSTWLLIFWILVPFGTVFGYFWLNNLVTLGVRLSCPWFRVNSHFADFPFAFISLFFFRLRLGVTFRGQCCYV